MQRQTAFTIVEVMVTTAILSLAMVVLFNSFHTSLNASSYLSNRLNAALEISNKLWQVEDTLKRSGGISSPQDYSKENSGQKGYGQAEYSLSLYPRLLNSTYNFYDIKVICSWLASGREFKLSRNAYVSRM